MSALPRFILLYAAMYAAYGVASPFLPSFLRTRGLQPEELGLVLAAGTAVRLLSAPLAGRIGDRLQALRNVLAVCIALAALATLGYLGAHGFWWVSAVVLLQAAALAPMTVLADALALRGRGFEYGWVRGTGSAAFIVGTLFSGQMVGALGLELIVPLQALLLGTAAVAAARVPERAHPRIAHAESGNALGLLRLPRFASLLVVAALILGSHAMHDAFAVIRWTSAGVSASTASLLWSEAVAAEVVVFFFIGPAIVRRLTPAGAMAVAASAGVLRWGGHGRNFGGGRPASPRLHASHRAQRARGSRRHGAGALWNGRHRRGLGVAYARLGRALRPVRCARLLADGGVMRARLAAHLETEARLTALPGDA